MCKSGRQKTIKGMFYASVASNRKIGKCFYRLRLLFEGEGAEAFEGAQPGQFLELDLSKCGLPEEDKIPEELKDSMQRKILLRRPFSFMDIKVEGNKTAVDILYCVVGAGSLRMTTLAEGDTVSVIGPLGNSFWIPETKEEAVLVIGGMGAPPLLHLAKVWRKKYPNVKITAIVGAKTADDFPFEIDAELTRHGVETLIMTDDGSAGKKGLVTDCLAKWANKNEQMEKTIIYGCGPEVMLAKVAEIAKEKTIDCQVSMERRMACGIGLCQSCAVECRSQEAGESVYKMCCKDGPVFEAKEVVFNV